MEGGLLKKPERYGIYLRDRERDFLLLPDLLLDRERDFFLLPDLLLDRERDFFLLPDLLLDRERDFLLEYAAFCESLKALHSAPRALPIPPNDRLGCFLIIPALLAIANFM